MRENTRSIGIFVILSTFCILIGSVKAQRFDITTYVGQIRYHAAETTLVPSWIKHTWFGLKSPDKLPTCQKYAGQYAIVIPDGNETGISMLLAAKIANAKIFVTIDNAVKFPDSSYCRLQYITLKD